MLMLHYNVIERSVDRIRTDNLHLVNDAALLFELLLTYAGIVGC